MDINAYKRVKWVIWCYYSKLVRERHTKVSKAVTSTAASK